ncbi:unnamed protein product [Meganyctiphanes norvegica]|uniref:Pirin n=1 Tax=Meganyctiphanes norvegica TaxID=48144 RepID=A0AAV2QLG5_MEGNR
MPLRSVVKKVLSVEQSEGHGARVRRSIGRKELRNVDPFLMLDEFKGDGKGGFPDHPHRGFETVTYMLSGAMLHEDFCGHEGVIKGGDLQWMTAGRGVVHSEMPRGESNHGMQLWVNLPAKNKMVAPEYQELLSKDIPSAEESGTRVKVIAGESMGVQAKVRTITPVYYLDFKQDPSSEVIQTIPSGWNAFIYTLAGTVSVGSDDSRLTSDPHHTLVLSQGDEVQIKNVGDVESHFILIAGEPIGEKIVQHGPFVMNSSEEIQQAINDYRLCQNGFEKAKNWQSKEGTKLMYRT